MASSVAIVHEADIAVGVEKALELSPELGVMCAGKDVAIKPNETWASAEDLTACTQADTVRAVIRHVKRFAPSRITVTGGSGAAETDDVFRLLGIDQVIREEGVEFFDHNRPPFVSVALRHGPQADVMINPRILEYDTIISLAQHKVHASATVTLTMKNVAMSFPAGDYYGHPRKSSRNPHEIFSDLHAFIVGMCERLPPSFGIIAGHPAMTGRGPIGGHVFESELAIAGSDFVAVDSVGAAMLGIEHVRHIAEAQRLGLGTADLKEIEVIGTPLEEAREVFRRNALAVRV